MNEPQMHYARVTEIKAKEIVGKMTDFLNTSLVDTRKIAFCDAMEREHRTLQQEFTGLCIAWMEHCASDEYRFDGRNEASHKLGQIVTKAIFG